MNGMALQYDDDEEKRNKLCKRDYDLINQLDRGKNKIKVEVQWIIIDEKFEVVEYLHQYFEL